MKLSDKKCACHGIIYKGQAIAGTRFRSSAIVESANHLESADIVTCFDAAVDSQRNLSTVEAIANSVGLYFNHKNR